jgi:uncharacterized protein (TIGR02594 family)
LNEASLELSNGVDARYRQTVDEKGNPTFHSLQDDIGNLGKDIQNRISSNITDPEVRRRFEDRFSSSVVNQQILSIKEQRRQQLEFTKNNIDSGIDGIISQASKDDSANLKLYISRAEQIIKAAVDSGVYTQKQANAVIASTRRKIMASQYGNLIDTNPEQAKSILKSKSPEELGIDKKLHRQLTDQANASSRDAASRAAIQQTEASTMEEEQQNMIESELRLSMKQGTAGEKEIIRAEQNGKLRKLQSLRLQLENKKLTKSKLDQAITNEKISIAVKDGKPLNEFTQSQVDKHYSRRIASVSRAGVAPTIEQKAGIAAQYLAKVKPLQKEIAFSLKFGDTRSAISAAKAYSFLKSEQPVTLDGLDKQTQAIAAATKSFLDNTTLSEREALNKARQLVLEKDDVVIQERRKEFDRVEDFSAEEIDSTIKSMYDGDGFFGSKSIDPEDIRKIKTLLQSAYLETGDVEAAKNMVKGQISSIFGPSEFNEKPGIFDDEEKLMFLPPEKAFPGTPVEALKADLIESVTPFLPEGVDPEDVQIQSDEVTRDPGRPISYGLYTLDENGNKVPLLGDDDMQLRWAPDVIGAAAAQLEEVEEAKSPIEEARIERAGIAETARREAILLREGIRLPGFASKLIERRAKRETREGFEASATGRRALEDDKGPITPERNVSKDKPLPGLEDSGTTDGSLETAKELKPNKVVAVDPVTDMKVVASPALQRTINVKETNSHFKLAKSFLGTGERTHTKILQRFFKASLGKNINPKHIPWCAAFVNSVMQAGGVKGTGSLAARSFLNWGTPTTKPEVGDIVVLSRGNNPQQGHVGFYAGRDKSGNIKVLGGNQKNKVIFKSYDKDRLLGFRKAPKSSTIRNTYKRGE